MSRTLLLFLPFLLTGAQDAAPPPVAVTYTLDVTDPASGTASVEMLVENNRDDEVTVGIPTWAPGSYRTVLYHQGIKDLEAEAGGRKIEVTPTDHKSLWKVAVGGAPSFKIRYTLKPGEVGPLKGFLTEEHYDLQGPSAWLFILDRMNGPHKVTFKLPPGWRVGTGLEKLGPAVYGERDYDTFIDCPIELGKFSLHEFKHDGVTYELVIHASDVFLHNRLIDLCRKIVAEQTRMFGGAPFDRYVFIYHFHDQRGNAGLEHLNSTHIRYAMSLVKEDPAYLASITSHEFFHLWNVKRIRPKELGPFDYTKPVRSKALWLCEGVTSYYGDLALARAGIWPRDVYLGHLAEEVTSLQHNPARMTQSVEQAGWTVWDRPWGGPSVAVNYYNKGELLGWLLDLKIRHATDGRRSFDDVMRQLYRSHVVAPSQAGKGPIGIGFEEGGILKAVNGVAETDFTDFFARYVSGTEELPYEEVIREAGLSMSRKNAILPNLQDLRVVYDPAKDSAAAAAGIRRGDRIRKVNGNAVANGDELSKLLSRLKVGARVSVEIARRGAKDPVVVELSVVEGAYEIRVSPTAKAAQKALREAWLAPSK